MKIDDIIKNKELKKLLMLAGAILVLISILISNTMSGGVRSKKTVKGSFAAEDKPSVQEGPGMVMAKGRMPAEPQNLPEGVGRKDPFAKPDIRQREGKGSVSSELNVSGITWVGEKPMAIINDMILGVGGKIEGKEIIKIESESVTVKDGEREYVLWLGGLKPQEGEE